MKGLGIDWGNGGRIEKGKIRSMNGLRRNEKRGRVEGVESRRWKGSGWKGWVVG